MTKQEMNRLIAEKCEGLKAIDDNWVEHSDRGGEHGWHDRVRIDDYFTDIAACFRAAHAWSDKEPDHRGFWVGIDSCHDAMPEAEAWDYGGEKDRRSRKNGESYATALASALVEVIR